MYNVIVKFQTLSDVPTKRNSLDLVGNLPINSLPLAHASRFKLAKISSGKTNWQPTEQTCVLLVMPMSRQHSNRVTKEIFDD